MANSYFEFKQFTVYQDKCAMKVGTDGVLLGAWTSVDDAANILDVGTGTGLISLMLAQRSSAIITAIDIDENAVCQAKENFAISKWKNRLNVLHADFRSFEGLGEFDLIVSNPPYFTDSLKSPDNQRSIARHDESLSYYDLLKGVSNLLTANGRFALIIPAEVSEKVLNLAASFHLYPCNRLEIITNPGKQPKRSLICFGRNEQEYLSGELTIELERHKYSDEYIALTKDFYLKMK